MLRILRRICSFDSNISTAFQHLVPSSEVGKRGEIGNYDYIITQSRTVRMELKKKESKE